MTDAADVPAAPDPERGAPGLLWWLAVVACLFALVVGTLATCGTVIIAQEAPDAPLGTPTTTPPAPEVPWEPVRDPAAVVGADRSKVPMPAPRTLTVPDGEVVPVLGAWLSVRAVGDTGQIVRVQIGPTDETDAAGDLVDATVDESVVVGVDIQVQAWAFVRVVTVAADGTYLVDVAPVPVDADNDDGSVVAGFEPGSTKIDDVVLTVGDCHGGRAVDLEISRGGTVLLSARAAAGDTWDVPDWRPIDVLGVDTAYSGQGCRLVFAAPSGPAGGR